MEEYEDEGDDYEDEQVEKPSKRNSKSNQKSDTKNKRGCDSEEDDESAFKSKSNKNISKSKTSTY